MNRKAKVSLLAVVCCVATLVFWAARQPLVETLVGPPHNSGQLTPNLNGASQPQQTITEEGKQEGNGRETKESAVPSSELKLLNRDERAKFDKAIQVFKGFVRELEFKNSKLRYAKAFDGKSVHIYELNPPSKEDLAEAQREIDRIIADYQMSPKERRTFARYAPESLINNLIPEGKQGSIFFEIPVDPTQNIFVYKTVGSPDIERLVKEVDQSSGENFSLGGGGLGESRSVSRTEAGWRYEKFLMIDG